MRRRSISGEAAVGLGVIALAAIIFWSTASAPASPAYAKVPPTAFPYAVGTGLAILGLMLAIMRWNNADSDPSLGTPDRNGLLWLGLGMLLNVGLIGWIGFTLASTLLFVCTARAFGSTQVARDAAIGFALALLAYVGFAKILGISLGAGLIEGFI